MGAEHRENSQALLHRLFRGYVEMVEEHVSRAIRNADATLGGSRAVRILDVGAGSVPYSKIFPEIESIPAEWVFIDCDSQLPGEHGNKLPVHTWIQSDFFDFYSTLKNKDAEPPQANPAIAEGLGGRFDVVILSAALHELYYDAVVHFACPIAFHDKAFAWLKDNILGPHGVLIIADYAWPSSAPAEHLWKIRKVQLEAVGHADPPWTFKSIAFLQKAASASGLQLLASKSSGLHDELNDEDLRQAYSKQIASPNSPPCKLTDAELETLRKRIGYVLVLTSSKSSPSVEPRKATLPRPNLASVVASINSEEVFSGYVEGDVKESLNTILVGSAPSRSLTLTDKKQKLRMAKTEEHLDHHPVLWHFLEAWKDDAEKHLSSLGIPDPGVFEVWMNLGLRFTNEHVERFVPRLPTVPHSAQETSENWPDKQMEQAGIFSAQMDIPDGCLVPGPVAVPYHRHLKGIRSLHGWFTDLHELMRKNPEISPSENSDRREIRSLTLMAQDSVSQPARTRFENLESTARSLYLASRWGTLQQQIQSGHYLLILPPYDPSVESANNYPLADSLNSTLQQIAQEMLPGMNSPEILPPEPYNKFLEAVFYPESAGSEDSGMWNHFKETWKGLPPYRCYSTLMLGCDGLSIDAPDTLMLFTSQALPPAALEDASRHFARICDRLSGLETQLIVRAKGREEQLAEMLSVFGHDAKNWAGAITGILETNWSGSQAAAKSFSESLTGRLACYSRLSSSIFDRKSESETFREDLEDARDFLSLENLYFTEIDAVIAQELTSLQNRAIPKSKAFFEDYFDNTERSVRQELLAGRGVNLSISGVGLNIPSRVTSTTPLLLSCIRLILSELIRNIIKYQWDYRVFDDGESAKCISLDVCPHSDGKSFMFELRSTPWMPIALPANKTYVGLLSVKLALDACGGKAMTVHPVSLGGSSVTLPYPNELGVSQFTIPMLGFGYE